MSISITTTSAVTPQSLDASNTLDQIQSILIAFADQYRSTLGASVAKLSALVSQVESAASKQVTGRLNGLQSTGDGAVVLGPNLASGQQLIDDLASIGFQTTADERYYVTTTQTDSQGNVIAGPSRHLGSLSEIAQLEALLASQGGSGNVPPTVTKTDAAGNVTTTQLFQSERVLTISTGQRDQALGLLGKNEREASYLIDQVSRFTTSAAQQIPVDKQWQRFGRKSVEDQASARRDSNSEELNFANQLKRLLETSLRTNNQARVE